MQIKKAGKYVLGCAVVNTHVWFLLATEIDSKPAVKLPGSHYVFNVTAAEWVSARLQARPPHQRCKHAAGNTHESDGKILANAAVSVQVGAANPELEYRYGEMLAEFPVAGYHYFCETVDISRPFPSSHAVADPSWEFVWNYYLTQPFRAAGLPGAAPHLLQGLAEARTLPDIHGSVFDVVLVARRSRLHAGTRYKARGLNGAGAPANEIECEQLVLRDGGAAWSSYVWRRGSVPLHWRQTVKGNGVGTAIAIEPERTFQGSRRCAPAQHAVCACFGSQNCPKRSRLRRRHAGTFAAFRCGTTRTRYRKPSARPTAASRPRSARRAARTPWPSSTCCAKAPSTATAPRQNSTLRSATS